MELEDREEGLPMELGPRPGALLADYISTAYKIVSYRRTAVNASRGVGTGRTPAVPPRPLPLAKRYSIDLSAIMPASPATASATRAPETTCQLVCAGHARRRAAP